MDYATEELSIFENGGCTFFLQKTYNQVLNTQLMLQLSVVDINEAFQVISHLKGFDIKYEPIKVEPWGKVIYLWGPSGELWHVTELNKASC
ncbi:lactoylglutathione lyase [Pseudocolwellia agarivorans]|uniref:lactoylglutathione lyase n=1 Tax=Pseudocolwellia agarivorans TaxID=1911682 RepID=UPI003183242F